MQMAIDVAGFTAGEADQLRQAMGSKRSRERMERLRARLYEGMAERGITGEVADEICEKLAAFANYGFPESHSVSLRLPGLRQRRGSSATTRPRSAPRCSTPSRWGSTRRTRWCRTPAATASRSRTPDLNASGADGHPRAADRIGGRPRLRGGRRCLGARRSGGAAGAGVGARRSGDDLAERDRGRARPTGPTPTWRTWRAGCRLTLDAARGAGHRRGVRLLRTPTARRSTGGGRCGRPGRWPRPAPTGWPGSSPGSTRPTLPGMSDREEAVGRPVGHRRRARRPPHPVRPRRPRPARAWCRPRACRDVDDGSQGAGRRRGHPPPAAGHRRRAPRSSTSRTRPG